MYTRAIDLFSKTKDPRGSLFYGNRAASYLQLEDYESVVEDCTKYVLYRYNCIIAAKVVLSLLITKISF